MSGSTWIQAAKELSKRIEPNQTYGLVLAAFRLSHTFRTWNIYVYLLFLSGTAQSLLSSYCSVWRTERNVRTVGAPSLIRCKRSKLNETYGPYERCLPFVTAFTVRRSKLRTVTVRVYWTCVNIFEICVYALWSNSWLFQENEQKCRKLK